MRPIRLATRYAKALFELATEQNIRDEVFADMRLLASICHDNREFTNMLQSPLIRFDKKNSIIRKIFGAHFHEATMAYTDIITRKRREMILDEIAEQYIIMYRESQGIKTARLITPVEADEKLKRYVINMLKEQLNAEIELETSLKPDLIGGFLLEVEGKQMDATIRKKINRLTREFNINIYERRL